MKRVTISRLRSVAMWRACIGELSCAAWLCAPCWSCCAAAGEAAASKAAVAAMMVRVMLPPYTGRSGPGRHLRFEIGTDRFEELLGGHPALLGADQYGQVLGHLAVLDGVDADLLQRLGEAGYVGRVVELA